MLTLAHSFAPWPVPKLCLPLARRACRRDDTSPRDRALRPPAMVCRSSGFGCPLGGELSGCHLCVCVCVCVCVFIFREGILATLSYSGALQPIRFRAKKLGYLKPLPGCLPYISVLYQKRQQALCVCVCGGGAHECMHGCGGRGGTMQGCGETMHGRGGTTRRIVLGN